MKREEQFDVALKKQPHTSKNAYYVQLSCTIDTTRLLIEQGLPFRSYDELKKSYNKKNYMESLSCLAEHDAL